MKTLTAALAALVLFGTAHAKVIYVDDNASSGGDEALVEKVEGAISNSRHRRAGGLQPGELKWEFDAGLPFSSFSISSDGTIYFDSGGELVSLNGETGITNWKVDYQNFWTGHEEVRQDGRPTIDKEGNIYVLTNKKLYAINTDGTKKWDFIAVDGSQDYTFSPSVAISPDGVIYFLTSSDGGKLIAVNSDGVKRWEFRVNMYSVGSAAIGSDGTIFFGTYAPDIFFAFNPDGTKKWQFHARTNAGCTDPAIGSDGTVYFGAGDKYYALNGKTGGKKWEFPLAISGRALDSPIIDSDGIIYVTQKGNRWFNDGLEYTSRDILYALNSDGTKKWEFDGADTDLDGWSQGSHSPVLGSNNMIYFPSRAGSIYAINTKTGGKTWEFKTSAVRGSPVIGSDGTIFFSLPASPGPKIYAIQGSGEPTAAPWPMHRQNAQNTGRAPIPGELPDYYKVKIDAVGGTTTGGGTYRQGDSIEIQATAGQGNVFTGWSGDASGMTNPLEILINTDLNITANFTRTLNESPPQSGDVISLTSPDGAVVASGEWTVQSQNLLAVSTSMGTNLYRVGVDGGVSFVSTVPKIPSGYGQVLSLSGDLLAIGRESEAAYVYRIQADNTVKFLANATGPTVGQSTAKSPASSPGWFARNISLSDDLMAISEHGEGTVYLYRISEDGGVAFLGKVYPPSGSNQSRFGESISLSGNLLAATALGSSFLYRIEPDGNVTYLNSVKFSVNGVSISFAGDILSIKPYGANKTFLYRVEADGSATEIQQLSGLDDSLTQISLAGDLLAAPPHVYRLKPNGELFELANLTGVNDFAFVQRSWYAQYALGANFLAAGGKVYFDSSWTPTVKIATVSLPYSGGSVTGGGQIFEGWNATLTAKSAGKYTFIGWTGDFTGKDNPLTLKADSNMTVIANFAMTFNVSATAVGGGTVTGAGPVPENEDASLTAVPDLGYRFVAWSNGASGTINPLTVTATSDLTITANFTQDLRDDDGDGLSNYAELVTHGTDKSKADTDGDGLSDKQELDAGGDPRISAYDWSLTTDLGSGWKSFDWFGSYYEHSSGWIYHTDLGWLYRVSEGTDSIWLYLNNHDWLWTSLSVCPYFYDAKTSNWMYFKSGDDKPRFYHYGTKAWVTLGE